MVKHYCDVCGKELTEHVSNDFNKVILFKPSLQPDKRAKEYEVCDYCLSKVYEVVDTYDPVYNRRRLQ